MKRLRKIPQPFDVSVLHLHISRKIEKRLWKNIAPEKTVIPKNIQDISSEQKVVKIQELIPTIIDKSENMIEKICKSM